MAFMAGLMKNIGYLFLQIKRVNKGLKPMRNPSQSSPKPTFNGCWAIQETVDSFIYSLIDSIIWQK